MNIASYKISTAQIITVILLLAGIIVGVYLVQTRQIFKPKAAINVSAAFEIKDNQGNIINCSGTTCYTNAEEISIRLKPDGLAVLEDRQQSQSVTSQSVTGEFPTSDEVPYSTPNGSPTESPAVSPIPTPSESSTQSTPAPTAVPVSNSSNVSPTCTVTGTNLSGICGKSDSAHTTAGDWNCSLATDYGVGYANCTAEYPNCYAGCIRN